MGATPNGDISETHPAPKKPPAKSGPGITPKTITIGLAWDPGAEKRAADLGFPVKYGNAENFLNIIVKDINAHGGIAGRTLKFVTWEFNGAAYQSLAEYYAAECAHFTEDVKVFTVFASTGDERSYSCYRNAHMPFFDETSVSDARTLKEYANYFTTGSMSLSRVARLMASGFWRQDFFAPGKKIGLVTFDQWIFDGVLEHDMIPALASYGVKLDEIAQVTLPENTELIGKMFADIGAAATKFCAVGIDRVMFIDAGGGALAGPFSQAAEGQKCRRFRYGLNSWDLPSVKLQGSTDWIAPEQLRAQGGAIGVGWRPIADIGSRRARAQSILPQAAERCFALMEAAGITYTPGCCEVGLTLTTCNKLWFFKAAVEAGGSKAINVETFRRGAESLGTRFQGTTSFKLRFGPKQHDGVAAYRDMYWDEACPCMQYVGPVREAP